MFEQQTRLLKLQCKNVEAEYEHFESEAGPRLLALRLRTAFQVFFALIATVIGLALAIVVYSATQSRSVVIEPFDIAPNIAAVAPSGKIVAAGLLDVLTKIQAASRCSAEHRNLSNAWTNEIAIDVPETGISIGQLERMVKTRFGHDQHIDGESGANRKGGLALTVRGTGILPKTFTDEARNLDKLLTQAGEYVYGQSQPGLFAAYLANNDRNDEAIAFSSERPTRRRRPASDPMCSITGRMPFPAKGGEGAMREALPLYREAVRLKPDYWTGYNNIMYALIGLGDEEGAVRVGEQMMKAAGGRPGRAPENQYQNYDQHGLGPARRAREQHRRHGIPQRHWNDERLPQALRISTSRRLRCRCTMSMRRPCGSRRHPSMRRTYPTSRRRHLIGRCSPKRPGISRQRPRSGTLMRWRMPIRPSQPPIPISSVLRH